MHETPEETEHDTGPDTFDSPGMGGPASVDDQPSERLHRLAALELWDEQERALYARAASEFVHSVAFGELSSDLPPTEAQKALLTARGTVVSTVESDRATLRTAIIEVDQTSRRRSRAFRNLIPLVVLVTVLVYVSIALVITEELALTTTLAGAAALLAGLTRLDSVTGNIREFLASGPASAAARRDLRAAEELFIRALTRHGFPEHIRSLRSNASRPYASPDEEIRSRTSEPSVARIDPMHLEPFTPENLVEVYNAGQQLQTRARQALTDIVAGLAGASIGVAGPRGVGKTTLLRWFFDKQVADFDYMTLCIPAPVRYEPRDFVLTVFSQLCESVAGTRRTPTLSPRRQQILTSTTTAIVGMLVTMVGAVVYFAHFKITVSSQHAIALGLMVVGAAMIVVRFVAVSRGPAERPDYLTVPLIRTRSPQTTADQLLREIRFQLTFSTGYSGKLTPGIAELGLDASYSLAANQESFPEVVGRFQAFLEAIAEARGRVFIGIDELDKLSPQDAVRFLDDVKGFFGVPGCFFVVSISEDALGQFERRGVPMRDTFDSAFDEVLRVEALRCDESIALLAKRGVNNIGLAGVCHILSGGLPRDLIRHARYLARISASRPTLARAARELIRRDVIEKTDGIQIAITSKQNLPEQISFTEWLCDLGRAAEPGDMLDTVEPYAICDGGKSFGAKMPDWGDIRRDFAERLACLTLVNATALELVDLDVDGTLSVLLSEADDLAEARLQIATSVSSAWTRCVNVRTRRGLTRVSGGGTAAQTMETQS